MPKSKNQIIGSCIFRNEGDGCLSSKYQHGDSLESPFIEGCKLITPLIPDDPFIGTYRTIWLEDNNNTVVAMLIISRNINNPSIFSLRWHEQGQPTSTIFEGTGMLFTNFLVAAYWD